MLTQLFIDMMACCHWMIYIVYIMWLKTEINSKIV